MRINEINSEVASRLKIRWEDRLGENRFVIASLDGTDVAWFRVERNPDAGTASIHASVDASVRRMGIASVIYDHIEQRLAQEGLRLVPFKLLSDEAHGFWNSRAPHLLNHRKDGSKWVVNEAPISDIHLDGPSGDFSKGIGFDNTDRKLLQSDKGRAKMVRAFRNTPFKFEVFFVNSNTIDGGGDDNERVDSLLAKHEAGVHDSYQGILGVPGTIRVVMISNLSPRPGKAPGDDTAKMPMTAWTLAHKIGHSFQDHSIAKRWNTPLAALVKELNRSIIRLNGNDKLPHGFVSDEFDYPNRVTDVLTMKSARDGKLTNRFEFFPEIVAQYLIKGQVKIAVDTTNEAARDHFQKIEGQINTVLGKMFDSIVGKVIAEA